MKFLSHSLGIALISLGTIAAAQAQSVPPLVQQFQQPIAKPAPAGNLGQFAGTVTSAGLPRLNAIGATGAPAHFMPSTSVAAAMRAAKPAGAVGPTALGTPPLIYHAGGRVMNPYVLVYPIFWLPSTLQKGGATSYSAKYSTVNYWLAAWLTQGHGLNGIATQYYEIVGGVTNYIGNWGGLGDYYVDTSPYPTSSCSTAYTVSGLVASGNCLTDAQIRAKIQSVMTTKGWTGGFNKIFMLFTSKGEGSCFDTTTGSCAYTSYCAYHSYFGSTSNPTIYANQPYASGPYCNGGTSPNGDIEADSSASVASHEIEEAVTDPLLNAWYDSTGYENGDECAWTYGTNPLKNPANSVLANQFMNGQYFELQQEWSNITGAAPGSCVDGLR